MKSKSKKISLIGSLALGTIGLVTPLTVSSCTTQDTNPNYDDLLICLNDSNFTPSNQVKLQLDLSKLTKINSRNIDQFVYYLSSPNLDLIYNGNSQLE